jgi:ATP-dependent Clp protease ATP-binding subunit ClpX
MDDLKCSFCEKERKNVSVLIAGPDENRVFICDSCVNLAHEYIHGEKSKDTPPESYKFYPHDIKIRLDEYVIGQEDAKKKLSVAVYNHLLRINKKKEFTCDIDKSNIIMIGPSGCGKTLLLKTIADIAGVPCTIANSTALTEAGYVGQDVESIFEGLVMSANGDIEKAQKGIVFLDEIDKKAKSHSNTGRDISGEGVQQALLKLVEGTELLINPDPTCKTPQKLVPFNTKDVLFIAGGAFTGIHAIVQKRQTKGTGIGVAATIKKNCENVDSDITPTDLHEYGLIREFIGRFPIIISLHGLDIDMLMRILIEPKNSILSQYRELFKSEGIDLCFADDYIKHIAERSVHTKTGARGLRNALEETLNSIQFDMKKHVENGVKKITINGGGKIEIKTGDT